MRHRRCVVTKYETLAAAMGKGPFPSDEKDSPEFILETTTVEYLDGGRHKGTSLRDFLEEWELDEEQ